MRLVASATLLGAAPLFGAAALASSAASPPGPAAAAVVPAGFVDAGGVVLAHDVNTATGHTHDVNTATGHTHDVNTATGHQAEDEVVLAHHDAATEAWLDKKTRIRSAWASQATAAAVAADPGQVGEWGPVVNWPVVGIHVALLPNGKVLAWDSVGDAATETFPVHNFTRATVYDPVTGAQSPANADKGYNLFCAGFAHLPDGSLFLAGGNKNAQLEGIVQTHLFNPANNGWSLGPNMAAGRWYPSVTPLTNGEMLITEGGPDTPEVRKTDGTLRTLSTATLNLPLYPWLDVAPDGRVFYSGPSQTLRKLDPAGGGSWQSLGQRDSVDRDYGSHAVYDIGKTLVAGGGPSSNDARVIDTNGATPQVSATSPMAFGRRQHNLTLLADGSALATGGNSTSAGLVDMNGGVYNAERWDPATGQWTTLAAQAVTRQYHSTAVLLPDGRVLSSGGGICGTCDQVGYLAKNAEVFTPPYLFKKDGSGQLAPRPEIAGAPGTVSHGTSFQITTPNAASIQKVGLLRLASQTHSVEMEQRYLPLTFTAGNGTLTASVPANVHTAAPGVYMLFIVNSAGVPSLAKMLELDSAPPPSNQPPVAVAGATPTSGTIPLTVVFSSASSSDPDGTIASYAWDLDGDGAFDDSTAANPSFQYTVAGSYSVRLRVTDNQGAPDDSDPLTITAQPPGGGPTYSQQVLADTPAAYWRLGEASGTTAADSSGANRTGSYLNTPTLGQPGALSGDTNTSAGFNGTNEYVSVPYTAALNPASFTVEAWAYVTGGQGTYRSLVTSRDIVGGSISGYILYAGSNNNWQLWTGNGTFKVLQGPAVALNTWTHVVGSYDGATMRLYVNGTLAASSPAAGYLQNAQRPLRIASGNTDGAANYFLPGRVDEVAVYGSALSAARISAHFTAAGSGGGGNQPPVAVAGATPTSGTIPLTVVFSSASSSDPDGTIASYAWDLDGDGAFDDSTAANPSFQYTVAGSYSVRLRVTDNQGAPDDSDPLTITAQPPGGGNQPPVAVAGATPTSGTIPLTVVFSSASSSDPDGTIASYAWDLDGDGAFDDSTAANPSFQYTVAGSYSVRLRVTDNQGAPDDSDPLTITAQPPGGGPTYSQQVLADTPAAYWRLGEASGTTAADSSGANRTGSYLNTPTLGQPGALSGDTNTSAGFNGTNEYVSVPYTAALNPASFTVEAWAYVTGGQGTYRSLVTSRDIVGGSISGYILYAGSNNNWQLWTGNGTFKVLQGPAVALNTWTHVVGSYDGATMRLYVNGTLAASSPAAGYLQNAQRPLRIASGNTDGAANYFLPGRVDEVAVYGSALSAARISAHFTAAGSGGGGNQPPVAVAGATPTSGTIPLTVVFSSASSSDPDGTIASYAWDLDGDGAFDDSTAANPSFQYTVAGSYSVRLRVTDNQGAPDDSDPLTITAQPPGGGPTYSQQVLADTPAAYWRLGEASGTTAADSSGANRTGSYLNTPTLGQPGALSGDTNTSAGFNGTNEYVSVPYTAALNPASFTVEAWAYVTGGQGTYRSLVTSRDIVGGSISGYILYAGSNNNWQLWTGNGTFKVLQGPAVALNTWTHVVGSYDGATMRLYVNGTLAASSPAAGYLQNAQRPLRIASGNTDGAANYFLPGRVDEVAVYGSALSAARISAHFTAAG